MNENEIKILKLSTNEEIVTRYTEIEDGKKWMLIHPIAMYLIDQGVRGFSNDWMCGHADEGGSQLVILNPDHVVAESIASERIQRKYLDLTN